MHHRGWAGCKIEATDKSSDAVITSVFSDTHDVKSPTLALPKGLHFNTRIEIDGLEFLSKLGKASIPVAFFDPQYRSVMWLSILPLAVFPLWKPAKLNNVNF